MVRRSRRRQHTTLPLSLTTPTITNPLLKPHRASQHNTVTVKPHTPPRSPSLILTCKDVAADCLLIVKLSSYPVKVVVWCTCRVVVEGAATVRRFVSSCVRRFVSLMSLVSLVSFVLLSVSLVSILLIIVLSAQVCSFVCSFVLLVCYDTPTVEFPDLVSKLGSKMQSKVIFHTQAKLAPENPRGAQLTRWLDLGGFVRQRKTQTSKKFSRSTYIEISRKPRHP